LCGFVAGAANILAGAGARAVPRLRVAGTKATPAPTLGAGANSVTPFALPDVRLEDGPIALAGRFGSEGIGPGEDLIANERTYGEVLDRRVDVPVWLGRPQDFPASVVASGEGPLSFRARGFERGQELELVPYYRIAHERYNLYWTVRDPESGML
jgi:hypothetical protein